MENLGVIIHSLPDNIATIDRYINIDKKMIIYGHRPTATDTPQITYLLDMYQDGTIN